MQILANADLSRSHTFSISQTCSYLVEVATVEEIKHVYQKQEWLSLPKLILGKGSNVLFTQPYQGVVVVNNLLGKSVSETDTHWHLHIAGGEDWPSLVKWSVEQGYFGLENLALIPGCAGSAPIQNIGAYGVELKDICEYVDVLCLETFNTKRLSAEECQFGYRDSIFKHELFQKVMVVAIGLKLPKQWSANIEYGPLQSLQSETLTAQHVLERVCQIRMEKLPDPAKLGNAGSFFKNPVISNQQFEMLSKQFPNIAAYPTQDGVKVAAGWLIDQCQLKGHQIGGAQVHPKQALVLVNTSNATANDVIKLAATVRQTVLEKYQIALEHEVRFIGSHAETNLETILESQQ
ncbi:UDP-N-acetylmuramate dehydrogenase [Vibrio coralliilyticus]|uniref:UDP-N-acetylmuramate dehydrogenase n=1 Tax=Vibrio coralliilyticus TaxID=190893 RepID=UPI000BAC1C64|nr:UDP-N-acetylmuramate dehydrogenase [Vibrio coralliilyticus]NOI77857.1 UDP-N-acetylmuramate dehydrogenase [Vibrio coralliilyticus]PAW02123.1 UDP-N-acetylenolpyruvoylglucosamine reductase [Vibrio coralliilyticus]